MLLTSATLTPIAACHSPRTVARHDRTRVIIDSVGPARLRVVADEADAAIATVQARDPAADERAWHAVLVSEGYWALHAREAAMHRAFTDSSFHAFLRSDSLARHVGQIETTLGRWRHADITSAVAAAAAYLPPGTPIRATLYFEVKSRLNTFVFRTDSGPSLFVAVDPGVSVPAFTSELTHELHHIGYDAACGGRADTAQATPFERTRIWLGAFGEGWAMLAAAGGPNVDPHAADDSAHRAEWHRAYGQVGHDMQMLDRFVTDVLDDRLATRDTVQVVAMSFFGPVQGPWYTVGYLMVRTVEATNGRPALLRLLCEPVQLLLTYQRIAEARDAAGDHLPLWSAHLVTRLRNGG